MNESDSMKSDASPEDQYFAAQPAEKLASSCMAKAQSFYNTQESNYYLDKIARMWQFYHGNFNDSAGGDSHQIGFSGEQGELTALSVNHFRNIAQHMLVMITANRPTMEARAVNTDYKSLAQTYLANGILDYYMREKKIEDAIRAVTEMAIVLGAGFIRLEWNATAGELYDFDPETGEKAAEGELEWSTHSPFDVVFDGTKESWDNEWVIVRTFKNKYNLIAKYPELATKINGIPTKNNNAAYRVAAFSNDSTDDVPVYEFYHKKTEALPDGRYCLFLDSDIVLLDMALPYRQIPIFRISAGEYMGTPYGYSPMFDVFPIQEGINSLYSTIMTNQSAFGVQNLFVERGSDISINSLEGAMNIIEGNKPPIPLNLTQTPKEIFDFLQILIQSAETISGVNSVARGDPQASLKSGTALALVQSMALQFISGLQNNYVKLIEEVGGAIINILKDYAKTPKTVALVGKGNRTYLKEFTSEDINAISRVFVSVGNPLARCLKKDTPVLMYDGCFKKVQDITIGEQLMGPDSEPRTVETTNFGTEEMYDIYENNVHEKFVYGCNASHILTLKYCSNDGRYGLEKGEIVDVSVREYLTWTKRKQRLFLGFRTGVEFQEKSQPIPPYILGLWLGDGTSSTTALTSMDKEIVNEWTNYAISIGLQVRAQDISTNNRAKTYFITSGQANGSSDRNSMMNTFREMELINNKHIPDLYKYNSRNSRLELLAGFIDTDGSMPYDGTYVISQCEKRKHIIDDLNYIAASLGMKTSIRKRETQSGPNKDGSKERHIIGVNYCLTIGGNTSEIPCRLPRKQCINRAKGRDGLNYSIKIVPQGEGEYYGFTLKEEPHFILGDFSVTHNTTAGRVQMAQELLQMQQINARQYIQVIETGSLDSIIESDMQESLLIKQENEYLMEGKPVLAEMFDLHAEHIMEHRSVMADPDLRLDPNLRQIVQDHMQQHINFLRTMDPDLLAITKQQALQAPMAPQVAPPVQGPGASGVMQQPGQNPQPGDMMKGQGASGGNMVPAPASPPGQFANLPTNAKDSLPQ